MIRWIVRLVSSGIRADSRWLLPILLAASFALGSLVPVEAVREASGVGLSSYCASVLGADLRIEVDSLTAESRVAAADLVAQAVARGAEIARTYETAVTMGSDLAEAPARIVVVVEGSYPLYGGELWSSPPEEALARGVAVSTNATKTFGLEEGSQVSLLRTTLPVTAIFPENLLTVTSSGEAGTVFIAADKLPGGLAGLTPRGREIWSIRLPPDKAVAASFLASLRETAGEAALLSSEDVIPVVKVGLSRLQQTFLWCALLIIFICAFGLAFGVEDYMNSKADEVATLKVIGLPLWLVGLVFVLRLAVVGVAGSVLAVALGSLMTFLTIAAIGAKAADMASLAVLARFPWTFLLVGPVLVLVFGGFPLLVRLNEKPHRVLWSKIRGFPGVTRTSAGLGSLACALILAVPVMIGLARWFCGPGESATVGSVVLLGLGIATFLAVAAVITLLGRLGAALPVTWRWPLTYLRVGGGRLLASTTAVAVAVAVGCGTALLDRVVDWELQAAVRQQVPFTVNALIPFASLTPTKEAAVSSEMADLNGVEQIVFCNVGYAFFDRASLLVKEVRLDDAALFGSTLAENLASTPPGVVACTLWEEAALHLGVAPGGALTLALGPSRTSGPQGEPLRAMVVGVDPRPGLRVGLNAPITVLEGTLPQPFWRYAGVGADPAFSSAVARELQRLVPQAEVYDFGAIEVMLRTAAEELSFLWWATTFFALLVSIIVFLTTSSITRIVRGFELALLRVFGVAGWRLGLGPWAEAVAQGLTCGLVGGTIGYLAIYRGFPVFFAADLPPYVGVPLVAGALALATIVLLQAWSLRRNLRRSPLDVLRSE